MAGSLLLQVGDVQIGADGLGAVLLRLAPRNAVTTKRTAAWVTRQFIPQAAMEMATSDSPLLVRPGMVQGADVPSTRRVEFEVRCQGATAADLKALIQSIAVATNPMLLDRWLSDSAITNTEHELAWMSPSGTKYVMYGRYRAVSPSNLEMYHAHRATLRIRFEASDPVIYECALNGATPPRTDFGDVPFGAYAETPGSSQDFVNPLIVTPGGDAPCRWSVSVTGHLTSPQLFVRRWSGGMVSHSMVGLGNAFSGVGIGIVPPGQSWTIDVARRLVLGGGHAVRLYGGRSVQVPHHAQMQPGSNDALILYIRILPSAWRNIRSGNIMSKWGANTVEKSWRLDMIRTGSTTGAKLRFEYQDTLGLFRVAETTGTLPIYTTPVWLKVVCKPYIGQTSFYLSTWPHEVMLTPSAGGYPFNTTPISSTNTGAAGPSTLFTASLTPVRIGGHSWTPVGDDLTSAWDGAIWSAIMCTAPSSNLATITRRAYFYANSLGWNGSSWQHTDDLSNTFTVRDSGGGATTDDPRLFSYDAKSGLLSSRSSWPDLWPRAEIMWGQAAQSGENSVIPPIQGAGLPTPYPSGAVEGGVTIQYRRGWWLPL